MPSFHQGDLFRALAASEEVDLEIIFAKDLPADRIDLGWDRGLTGFNYRFLDERNKVADAVRLARAQRNRIHIMNGLWAERGFAAALITLALLRSRYAIYSEAPDPSEPRSALKKAFQSVFGKTLVPRAVGILAVSKLAAKFFKGLNAADGEIYPFGYFRSLPGLAVRSERLNNRVEIIFVGQLIHRKGILLLLEAITPILEEYPNLFLSVIGKGEMSQSIQQQVDALGLTDRIVFEGVMPSSSIPGRLATADLLVLPSRFDGWGMVVNEALSVGTPVIVSDRCGSADLVQNEVNGYVFRSEDVPDLRRCITSFLKREPEWTAFRAGAAATGTKISAEAAASYLVDCLKHMTGGLPKRPSPPWVREAPTPASSLQT